MSDLIRNPRKKDVLKDVHVYVSDEVYVLINALVKTGQVTTKTDYINDLIEKDLKKRELM